MPIIPNPVIDIVKIQSSGKVEKVLIFNYSGILQKTIQEQREISMKEFPPGVYLFKIQMKDSQQIITQKVIKK